jgi:hypothetical protein
VGLCFVAFMLCNMDRVNMSVAILPMSQQYGWTSTTVGLVQSSFFWWGQMPVLGLSAARGWRPGCLPGCLAMPGPAAL